MAAKRTFNLSEGNTPGKPRAKVNSSKLKGSRKSLFGNEREDDLPTRCDIAHASPSWSAKEDGVVVEYICLYWKDAWTNKWPNTKAKQFWNGCSQAVNRVCNTSRSGTSCRTRVTKSLCKKYATLTDAENDLNIDYIFSEGNLDSLSIHGTPSQNTQIHITDSLSPVFQCSPSKKSEFSRSLGDVVKDLLDCFRNEMTQRLKRQLVNYLYKHLVIETGGMPLFKFVGSDFLQSSLSAMNTLYGAGKHNLVSDLSKCFSTCSGSDETRMPLYRMPFGMIDYNIRFFAAEKTQKLGIENHYVQWLETMFAHFGHKWFCLHRGPCWQYELEDNPKLSERLEQS